MRQNLGTALLVLLAGATAAVAQSRDAAVKESAARLMLSTCFDREIALIDDGVSDAGTIARILPDRCYWEIVRVAEAACGDKQDGAACRLQLREEYLRIGTEQTLLARVRKR